MSSKSKELWDSAPAAHDFDAAADYLSLLFDPATVRTVVRRLRTVAPTAKKAKDLLRASGLALLAVDDKELLKDLKKVKKGEQLSPVLLVRGGLYHDRLLTVADGYHRICASYHINEDADIPCHIADLPPPSTGSARRS
jgi:HEAT repeat protein